MATIKISQLPVRAPLDTDIIAVMGEDGKVYGVEYRYLKPSPIPPTPSGGGTVNVKVTQQNNNEPNPNFQERTATARVSGNNTKASVSYEIRDI